MPLPRRTFVRHGITPISGLCLSTPLSLSDWKGTVQLETHREGDAWVATCPALDVASHGDTREEAYRMLEEALAGFFEDCCEHGTLLDVLAKRQPATVDEPR